MKPRKQTKVLVLGAGIGGLTAAVALRRAGFEVEIHERAAELRPAGSGIAVLLNALRALRTLDLGLEDQLAARGGAASGFRFATTQGETIRELPPELLVAPDGLRSLSLHRADVQQVLLDALDRPIQFGRTARRFEDGPDGVTVTFEDGREARGDLLVGADGIHSAVRGQLHGVEAPRPGGFICWLATVPFDHAAVGPGHSTHYWGRGKRFGLIDIGGGRFYWWGTKTTNQVWSGTLADVRAEFAGWAPEVEAVLAATTDDQLIAVPAQDRPPLPAPWGTGHVTLLGDAAHPMLPSLAQGANQAIEDAIVLARELAVATDLAVGLRRYEARRAPRTKQIVDGSRRLGAIEQITNPVGIAVRDQYFRRVPERALVKAIVKPTELPPLSPVAELPRDLSPHERWLWILGTLSPMQTVVRVRIEGPLDAAEVRDALDELQARHPLLRATVQRTPRGDRPRFVHGAGRIPLQLERSGDEARVGEIAGRLTREACDFADGPLLSAVLASDADGTGHDLLLAAPFLIADGDAALALAHECLELVAGTTEALGRDIWSPSADAVVPSLEDLLPASTSGVGGTLRTVRAALADQAAARRAKPQRIAQERELPAAERASGLARAALGAEQTRVLLAASRTRGVHPRAVVAAALASAIAETAPTEDHGRPVQLAVLHPARDALGPESTVPPGALGAYQALVGWFAKPAETPGLWDLARDAQARGDAARAAGADLAALSIVRAICPASPEKAGKLAATLDRVGAGVSLNYVESPFGSTLADWKVGATEVAVSTSLGALISVAATSSDAGLSVDVAFVQGAVPRGRAERVATLVVRALDDLAALEAPSPDGAAVPRDLAVVEPV